MAADIYRREENSRGERLMTAQKSLKKRVSRHELLHEEGNHSLKRSRGPMEIEKNSAGASADPLHAVELDSSLPS